MEHWGRKVITRCYPRIVGSAITTGTVSMTAEEKRERKLQAVVEILIERRHDRMVAQAEAIVDRLDAINEGKG
jgi:hypothetical protein